MQKMIAFLIALCADKGHSLSMIYTLRTLLLAGLIFSPAITSAHQPRIVEGSVITVTDPEISKAYYATLQGSPHVYHISSALPFHLYVNILVPDIVGQRTDVMAEVIDLAKSETPLAVLGGVKDTWKQFFEPFGYDSYLMASQYKVDARAGDYDVRVSSPNNDTMYSLAIGEIEMFDAKEGMHALAVIPAIKRDFFRESPVSFILSPFGFGEVLGLFLAAFLFGFAYRFFLKKFASKKAHGRTRNIGSADRWLRAALGVILFVIAITTTWSPLLLFASGFCFLEAIFSWCGLYAAMGRSSCPV